LDQSTGPHRTRRGRINLSDNFRLSLNRSQCGSCSTEYDSPAGIKVVYSRFRTSTLPSECTGNGKHSYNTSQGSLNGVELAELTIVPRAKKDVQWYRCHDKTGFCLRGVQPVIALTQVPGCQKLSNTIPKKSSEVAPPHPVKEVQWRSSLAQQWSE
jgi:hypothetical protein